MYHAPPEFLLSSSWPFARLLGSWSVRHHVQMSRWQRGTSAHHSQHQLPSEISVLVLVALVEALASHLNRVHFVVGIAMVVCSEGSRSLVGEPV